MSKSETICDCCGKVFMRENKHLRQNRRHGNKNYCSQLCVTTGLYHGHKTEKEVTCSYCGKIYLKYIYKIKQNKTGKHFCCSACRGLYLSKQHDDRFIVRYRKKALKILPNHCSVCGYSVIDILEVHHKDGDRDNSGLDNLDILCPTHHKEYHHGIRQYI